jgi:aryl-alcohol dehydrogenase-like predicted oxidoreductase
MATPLRMARPFLRRVIHHLPGVRRLVRRSSPHSEKHGFYNLDDARLSLERSLRQLRTDYLDCLFIQDCSPSDPLTDELFDFLKGLVANGKIRAWGYATRRQWLSDICRRNSNQPMILQHEQSLFDTTLIGAGIDSIPAIYHSPFGGPESGRRIAQAAATVSGSTEPEFRRLTVRLSKPKARSRFLLEAALLMSGDRPVLCSMFDLKHIRENVAAVNEPHFIPEHVAHIRHLLIQTDH